MVTLIFVLFFLSVWHYLYEAVIAPSFRMYFRNCLFEQRDELRKICLTVELSRPDNEAFELVQEGINRFLNRVAEERRQIMGLYQAACPQCQKEHLWFPGISDQRCEACKNPFAPTPQQPLDDCTKAKLGLFDPAKPVPGQKPQEQPGPREWWALLENDPGSHEYGRVNEYEFNIPGSFKVVEKSALTLCEERLAHFQSLHREFVEKLTACEAKLAEAEARWGAPR